jgi:hypothetical protein
MQQLTARMKETEIVGLFLRYANNLRSLVLDVRTWEITNEAQRTHARDAIGHILGRMKDS